MAKNFNKVTEKLSQDLLDLVGRSFLEVLARKMREVIYRRTKSGKGVSRSGDEQPLKSLSPHYVDYRKRAFGFDKKVRGVKIKQNLGKQRLGEFGSPGKSNLTLTGETLDSIQFKIERFGFRLYFPDTKHKFSKRVTVREVARYVQMQGRPFFSLSRGERRILLQEVQKEVRKQLRRK